MEYWPEVVVVWTEGCEVCAKTTEGLYSSVLLKQARLVSSLLHDARTKHFCFYFAGFGEQEYAAKTYDRSWKRFVWQNPDRVRTNQNAPIYLTTTLPYYQF